MIRPKISPPRCACQATLGDTRPGTDQRPKKTMTTTHSGIGTIKYTITFNLGTITTMAPASAKTAPEAPTATEMGSPSSR